MADYNCKKYCFINCMDHHPKESPEWRECLLAHDKCKCADYVALAVLVGIVLILFLIIIPIGVCILVYFINRGNREGPKRPHISLEVIAQQVAIESQNTSVQLQDITDKEEHPKPPRTANKDNPT